MELHCRFGDIERQWNLRISIHQGSSGFEHTLGQLEVVSLQDDSVPFAFARVRMSESRKVRSKRDVLPYLFSLREDCKIPSDMISVYPQEGLSSNRQAVLD